MSINPINLNKIAFKGPQQQLPVNSDANTPVRENNQKAYGVSSIPSELNVKTPIAYKKITDLTISGAKDKAAFYKLANGQKIVILPKTGPTVVKTYFNVGSMNEPDHLRGISHYIEHNLFNGSKDLKPGEFFQRVSGLGAYTNASTGYNQTNYYIESNLLEDNYLEEIMKLHSDQIQHPLFPQDQLEKEKGPVTSEISMYADMPSNVGRNIALKNLFNIKSSSDDLVAGTVANINSITQKDVIDYYNTWYSPDNSLTVITTDAPVDKTIELAAKYFTKNTLSNNSNRKYEELIPTEKPVRVDIKKSNATAAIINMGFVGPSNNDSKAQVATKLLTMILTGYQNARITKALEPYQIDAGFSTEKIGNKAQDKKAIFAEAAVPEEKCETALKIIYEEIFKISQNPPSEQELNIVKEKFKMALDLQSESSSDLNDFIGSALLDNDFSWLSNCSQLIDSINIYDIQNAAKNYMDLNKASISVVHPETSTDEKIKSNYQNTHFGKNTKSAGISFGSLPRKTISEYYSNVKEYRLNNNMEVVVQPNKSDFDSYEINFTSNKGYNLTTPEIIILNSLLSRGTMQKDNTTFNNILDCSNTNLYFDVSTQGISIGCRTPEGNLTNSLNLAKEVLAQPRFTQEDFEWAKQNLKDTLLTMPKSPGNKLKAALYPNLPSMNTVEEDLKTVDSLTLDRIKAIYSEIMQDAQGYAVLSANTEEKPQLQAEFMNSLASGIQNLKPYTPNLAPVFIPNQTEQILTETENKLQSEIQRSYKFKKTGNIDDQAKLMILNMILGGNSTSRLFQDLREKQKLAYRVSSSLLSIGDTSAITMSIGTTTDDDTDPLSSPVNIQKSLEGFNKHINKLKTELVSEEELKKSKLMLENNILSSMESSLSRLSDISIGKASMYGIKETQYLLDAIEKLTPADILAAANYAFASPPVTSILASERTLKANNLK